MINLNNRFNTIVFDLDGPLLDGKHRHYRCYADILKEQEFIPVDIDSYWLMKKARIDRHKLLERSSADTIYNFFLQEWLDRIETRPYLQLDFLQPGVLEILTSLQKSGIRLILATMRNNKDALLWQLESLKLKSFFSEIIIIGSLGENKNKAADVAKIIENHDYNKTLWIGDTEVDIYSARELGVKICALSCGLRTKEYLLGLQPDYLHVDLMGFFKQKCLY